jgi:hypothetical protein
MGRAKRPKQHTCKGMLNRGGVQAQASGLKSEAIDVTMAENKHLFSHYD